jgi:voltage-gated potassium channel
MQSPAENFKRLQQRFLRILLAIVAILLFGTLGYMVTEHWSLLDALYMTVITLAGVGYGEVHPLDTPGRIFTIGLILLGVVALATLLNQVIQDVAGGYFREGLEFSRQQRMINKMSGHFIVCGYGRMGRRVCEEFASDNAPFVVIEASLESCNRAKERGFSVLNGDASTDALLAEAGIERAKCIVCALPSDADNLFIILSARNLNPNIRTITRSSSDEAAVKLKLGGADEVVSPYDSGARRMASIALRPNVVDFMETTVISGDSSLYIEEVQLSPQNCPFLGQTLQQTDLRAKTGTLVLAIRREDGTLIGNPTGSITLAQGDRLFCMGTNTQLRAFTDLVVPAKL